MIGTNKITGSVKKYTSKVQNCISNAVKQYPKNNIKYTQGSSYSRPPKIIPFGPCAAKGASSNSASFPMNYREIAEINNKNCEKYSEFGNVLDTIV